ncbi:MAG: dioxygenase [Magnetospirillum sp.]|nr:dioxygenase [Magnetospirillum sp.]
MDYQSLFLSHGSPMMVLEDSPARRFLQSLGPRLGKPPAVIAMSAHWPSRVPVLGFAAWPDKINDIYGFPPDLYQLEYAPPGAPEIAARAADLLGGNVRRDPGAGIDHGIWSVMSLIWPEADVPVVPLSVQPDASPAHHFEIGRRLRPLAEDGVLILGTGAATHNLKDYFRRPAEAPADAGTVAFTQWLAEATGDGDTGALLEYRRLAPHAIHAHPTDEHLLPFFAALGASRDGRGDRLHQSLDSGILAMDAYGFR